MSETGPGADGRLSSSQVKEAGLMPHPPLRLDNSAHNRVVDHVGGAEADCAEAFAPFQLPDGIG